MERARAGSKPVDVPVQLVSAESEGRRQIEFQERASGVSAVSAKGTEMMK